MPLTTILVEDSKVIRDTLIPAMTELAGMDVVGIAETSDDAVAMLYTHRHTWQVAVVDIFLREGSGLTVIAACRERTAQQKVVVITNYPTAEIRRRCAELGADALFDKSTELDAFFDFCQSIGPVSGPT